MNVRFLLSLRNVEDPLHESRSLAFDTHGKSPGSAIPELEIDCPGRTMISQLHGATVNLANVPLFHSMLRPPKGLYQLAGR